jgi:GxxExxY protein
LTDSFLSYGYDLPQNSVLANYRPFIKTREDIMEFHVDNQLDEKTEILLREIIGAAIDVHRELGPGYLEKVYEQAMALELRNRGLAYATQVPIAVLYKGEKIHGHVLDMAVEGKVILELKSVETLLPIHEAQILSYLKSTGLIAGLLINFKEKLVKNGIRRFVRTKRYS